MNKYEKMTSEDFDRLLGQVVSEYSPIQLLYMPGVYECLSEEFNNEVLARWEIEQTPEEGD